MENSKWIRVNKLESTGKSSWETGSASGGRVPKYKPLEEMVTVDCHLHRMCIFSSRRMPGRIGHQGDRKRIKV